MTTVSCSHDLVNSAHGWGLPNRAIAHRGDGRELVHSERACLAHGRIFLQERQGTLSVLAAERIPRTDFWVGLIVVAGMTTLAILLNGNHIRGGALGELFAVVTAIAVLSPVGLPSS